MRKRSTQEILEVLGVYGDPDLVKKREKEVAAQKKRDGQEYNQEWHQKVRRKQKVCQAFLEEIANLDEAYEAIYQKYFMTLLTEYISTQELDEIIKKAKVQTDLKILEMKEIKLKAD